jgi:hypothetical protein
MVLGLSVSAARDGAPTHHAERALLPLLLVLAVVVGAAIVAGLGATSRASRLKSAGLVLAAMAVATVVGRAHPSDEAASVDRSDEVAIGEAAARMVAPGERVLIEVVDYGYLAVLAGFGRSEDIVVDRDIDPRRAVRASSFASPEALGVRVAEARASVVVGKRAAPGGVEVEVRGAWSAWKASRAGSGSGRSAP